MAASDGSLHRAVFSIIPGRTRIEKYEEYDDYYKQKSILGTFLGARVSKQAQRCGLLENDGRSYGLAGCT